MKSPKKISKKNRCLKIRLWQLKHGPLNLLKVAGLCFWLLLVVPYSLLGAVVDCLIAIITVCIQAVLPKKHPRPNKAKRV